MAATAAAAAAVVSASPSLPLAQNPTLRSLHFCSSAKPYYPAPPFLLLPSAAFFRRLGSLQGLSLCPSLGIPPKNSRLGRAFAANGDALPSEAAAETAQQIAPAAADGITNTVVSSLLIAAFVGLSILTIGVVYIAVTDFLQRREREKFEKEEADKKKKGGKKVKVRARARAGPRGFGQKIEEEADDV